MRAAKLMGDGQNNSMKNSFLVILNMMKDSNCSVKIGKKYLTSLGVEMGHKFVRMLRNIL